MAAEPSQELAARISRMDRKALIDVLRRLRCNFELDFTDEFLNSISLSRLRHIVIGASLHAQGCSSPNQSG